MKSAIIALMCLTISLGQAAPGFLYAALPAPVADTKVVRDYLGNQATSYAYHDGHSSGVALSRNDITKHGIVAAAPAILPAVAPAVYTAPALTGPAVYSHHTPAVYSASAYQYHNQYPGYAAYAAPHTAYAAPHTAYASPYFY